MNQPIKPSRRLHLFGGVLVLLLSLGWAASVWSDPAPPTITERNIVKIVADNLGRDHLTRHPVDDEISQRTMKLFLEMLDPMKVYFYQSDIDEFMRDQNNLDDMVKAGDLSFAFKVYKVFLQRIDERIKLVDELLAVKHDFTKDEEMVRDKHLAQYARNEDEARDRWRKRIKFDLLAQKADKEDDSTQKDPVTRLTNRYHSFARRMHQTDSEELMEMFMTSMSMAFDPHTSYMSPGTLKNFEIQMALKLEGIGAALRAEDEYTIVEKIIPGGPADKDGRLKPKDRVVAVAEGDGEFVDVVGMKLTDVVDKIRGREGTVVRLKVTSEGKPEPRIIELTRKLVELKDSEARSAIFKQGQKPNGQPYQIGVIDLPSFYMDMEGAKRGDPNYRSTTRDVKKILEDFNRQGVDACVLDLRLNGGGSLQEAINLTGLFVGEGPVVQVKGADGRVTPYNDTDGDMAWKGPLVVLISKYSASASEILAGAIQDYRRGLIVGDHSTHGKGTVQSLTDLGSRFFGIPNGPALGALKITMQQFFRPDGDSTQKMGVLADLELPSLSSVQENISEADLDYPVDFARVKPLEFKKFNFVNPALVDRLHYLSQQRIGQSTDFQKVLKEIAIYLKQKEKKYVTLNEDKFMAEIKELDADKKERDALEKLSGSGSTAIERDYYLNEALNIAQDYLQQAMVAQAR